MRKLTKIILHCADTKTNQDFSVQDVRNWHIQRGWSDIGYHFYIKLSGSLYEGRELSRIGAHCKGYNSKSVGICFEGGKNELGEMWDKPTDNQIKTVVNLIKSLREDYGEMGVHGHYEFSGKSCPNFDPCILDDLINN